MVHESKWEYHEKLNGSLLKLIVSVCSPLMYYTSLFLYTYFELIGEKINSNLDHGDRIPRWIVITIVSFVRCACLDHFLICESREEETSDTLPLALSRPTYIDTAQISDALRFYDPKLDHFHLDPVFTFTLNINIIFITQKIIRKKSTCIQRAAIEPLIRDHAKTMSR